MLSTVSHLADNVYELVFEDVHGRRETVKPTGTHPFFDEDRKEWVGAERLQAGQRVRGRQGTLRTVSVQPVRGVQRVYNITVEGEHVYYVSTLAAWRIIHVEERTVRRTQMDVMVPLRTRQTWLRTTISRRG